MNRPTRQFVNVDELMQRVSVDDVLRFYGIAADTIHRLGDEIRTRCFLNCSKTEPTGDRALSIKLDDDAKRWCCHRYECEHRQGGNLVGLIDLVKPGPNMNGRPRGERFKAILGDLQQIARGTPLTPPTVAANEAPQQPPAALKVNVPLAESENERARAVVNLHEKLIADPAAMNPAAASYFRRRPYLTEALCAKWKIGYLPHDTGGHDRSGGTMRGKIVYPVHDEQGRVLTWFGRDPQFEEKHAAWKGSNRSEREPEKVHFVKGYHRGLQFFGEHRLAEPEVREAIQALRHLLLVEGPNNTLRLDALNVPALAICSNRITREQAERVGRWCRELNVTAAVLFDGDAEGEAGAQQAVVELAQHCSVRLTWSRAMFDGRFKDRQPETLSDEEWQQLCAALLAR